MKQYDFNHKRNDAITTGSQINNVIRGLLPDGFTFDPVPDNPTTPIYVIADRTESHGNRSVIENRYIIVDRHKRSFDKLTIKIF